MSLPAQVCDAVAVRVIRLRLDITCRVIGHRWWVDREADLGRGYCTRCGKNDHVWLCA